LRLVHKGFQNKMSFPFGGCNAKTKMLVSGVP
jgi:hypothetical protein